VACSGASCTVSFSNCKFENCQLVVLTGAYVTLENPTFTQSPLPEDSLTGGVSIYTWGVGTLVRVNGGSITGGLYVSCSLLAIRLQFPDMHVQYTVPWIVFLPTDHVLTHGISAPNL
jgi:hypothetical protein